jgi:hypothetical protein
LRACKGEGITPDAANKQNQRSRSNRIHFTLAARDSNSDFAVNLSPARLHVTIEINQPENQSMLWTIFVILLVLWLLGFLGHVGGGLIHLLLVIAVVVLIINLIQGRRSL